jgi:Methyl-accepting chemotaxis protein
LNRKRLLAAAGLIALHALCSTVIGPVALRTILIVLADAALVSFFILGTGRGKKADATPETATEPPAASQPCAPAPVPAAPAAAVTESAAAELRERFDALRASLACIPETLDGLLADGAHLASAQSSMDSLKASVQDLESHIADIMQNTDQVIGVANILSESAENGFTLSQNVQTNVVALTENIAASLAETAGLLEESEKISEILTIMANIAATTNVLSINASIVAARAGTKGKEFEVVAREIRKLSVSTDESLSSISSIIKNIQHKIVGVSDRLSTVNSEMTKEKDSMLSVAGSLQGITLSVGVIQSVTGVSGEKAQSCRRGLADTLDRIGLAAGEIRSGNSTAKVSSIKDQISAILRQVNIDRGES